MTDNPKNPRVFPSADCSNCGTLHESGGHRLGVTLRDEVAIKAMLGFLSGTRGWFDLSKENVAHHAYQMADTMLAERENNSSK